MVRDTYILYTETQRVTTYILYNKYEMAGEIYIIYRDREYNIYIYYITSMKWQVTPSSKIATISEELCIGRALKWP
jgi:hypothetical protein